MRYTATKSIRAMRSVLATFGGFEIAAIAGFILAASKFRLPVVLDGFPCCVGALVAKSIDPDALSTTFFSHESVEPACPDVSTAERAPYYVELTPGRRYGQRRLMTGIIDSAVRLYREMATFSEAGGSAAES